MFGDLFSVLQDPMGRIALLLIFGVAVVLIVPKVALYFLIKRRAVAQTLKALREAGDWMVEATPKKISVEQLHHELSVLDMHNDFGSFTLVAKKLVDHKECFAVFYEGGQTSPTTMLARQPKNMTQYSFGVALPIAPYFSEGLSVTYINEMLQALSEPNISGPDAAKFNGHMASTVLQWFGSPDPARRLYIKGGYLFILYQLYHNPYAETKAMLDLAQRFPSLPELQPAN